MISETEQVYSETIDHLGLVAATIHDIGLIEKIDNLIPINKDKGANLTIGQRIAGMIINGLGFVDTRLYMYAEFLADKPLERLIGKDVLPEYFTDDALARGLDEVAKYGVEKLFASIAYPIALENDLLGDNLHMDTTSFNVFGDDYVDRGLSVNDESLAIPEVNHGHSKAHRPDLKQIVLNMATTGAACFPIWMESHSGNVSDQKVIPESFQRVETFIKSIHDDAKFLYVADSAAYSNCIKHNDNIIWLSRVPERIKICSDLLGSPDDHFSWDDHGNGYKICSIGMRYENVNQYWSIVFSQQAYDRERKTFEKKLSKLDESLNKATWHLSCQNYACKEDAQSAINDFIKKLKYHVADFEIKEVKQYSGKGRPKKNQKPDVLKYCVELKIERNLEEIDRHMRRKGRFVLATNDTESQRITPNEMLLNYKKQSGTESGFAFMKNKDFQVSSIHLHTPHRISALMMIMTLCLMVYCIAQHKLRKALIENSETIPNQNGKETNNPTMLRVFRLFLGIQLLIIVAGSEKQEMLLNLNHIRIKIINLFGSSARSIYGLNSNSDQKNNKI
jgi:transposase